MYTFEVTSERSGELRLAIMACERRLNSARSLTTRLPKNVDPFSRVGS